MHAASELDGDWLQRVNIRHQLERKPAGGSPEAVARGVLPTRPRCVRFPRVTPGNDRELALGCLNAQHGDIEQRVQPPEHRPQEQCKIRCFPPMTPRSVQKPLQKVGLAPLTLSARVQGRPRPAVAGGLPGNERGEGLQGHLCPCHRALGAPPYPESQLAAE